MSQQLTASASDLGSAAKVTVPAHGHGSSRHVRLAALPSAVPWARRILRHMLREWRLEGMSDPALLVVSELVTNAVQASPGQAGDDQRSLPMIGLSLRLTDTALMAEVWDTSPDLPVLQESDLAREGGRGLVLVNFLADSWGHRAAAGGKVVWCTIALPDGRGAASSAVGRLRLCEPVSSRWGRSNPPRVRRAEQSAHGPAPTGPGMAARSAAMSRLRDPGFQRALFKRINVAMLVMWRLGLGRLINFAPAITGRVMVIVTTGRRSGRVCPVPITYAPSGRYLYCLAGFGTSTSWYRNALAHPDVELWLPDGRWTGHLEPIRAEDDVGAVREVFKASAFASKIFEGVNPATATDDELRAMAERFPLARITLTGRASGPGYADLAWLWPAAAAAIVLIHTARKVRCRKDVH